VGGETEDGVGDGVAIRIHVTRELLPLVRVLGRRLVLGAGVVLVLVVERLGPWHEDPGLHLKRRARVPVRLCRVYSVSIYRLLEFARCV